jgi:hypothetical protein
MNGADIPGKARKVLETDLSFAGMTGLIRVPMERESAYGMRVVWILARTAAGLTSRSACDLRRQIRQSPDPQTFRCVPLEEDVAGEVRVALRKVFAVVTAATLTSGKRCRSHQFTDLDQVRQFDAPHELSGRADHRILKQLVSRLSADPPEGLKPGFLAHDQQIPVGTLLNPCFQFAHRVPAPSAELRGDRVFVVQGPGSRAVRYLFRSFGRSEARAAAEDLARQGHIAAETVGAMWTRCHLTRSEQTLQIGLSVFVDV